MDTHRFIGLVQNRARLATEGEALRAISATLQVLGRRLAGNEPIDLAPQLSPEIAHYLLDGMDVRISGENDFDLDEFFLSVADLEGCDVPDAIHHARAVISVLQEAVSQGEIDDLRAQLPEDYDPLFEGGSEGRLRRAA